MIRLIGELSIQHSIIKNAKESESLNTVQAGDAINLSHKVIQDLQSETMSLRMQPLEGLFQRMERVARDVARQQNKKINVVLKGTDVELDKTVIEQMKDPLVHILRNAVDHGIESEDARSKSGKSPTATILIEGLQTATNVTIRISDDGQGLNEDKILQKARERGLIASDAQPPPHDIHQMIFLPGFSTADKVTDVSGRGFGMDVVRQAVNDLSGDIEITSIRSKGYLYIARGDYHIGVKEQGADLKLMINQDSAISGHRPSVDYLFCSAASTKQTIIAALLTGMGKDGAYGLSMLKQQGAQTLAQDEASCIVFGMPKEAISLNAARQVCNPNDMRRIIDNALGVFTPMPSNKMKLVG